jgi:uracil-DNA glycosylase family 4
MNGELNEINQAFHRARLESRKSNLLEPQFNEDLFQSTNYEWRIQIFGENHLDQSTNPLLIKELSNFNEPNCNFIYNENENVQNKSISKIKIEDINEVEKCRICFKKENSSEALPLHDYGRISYKQNILFYFLLDLPHDDDFTLKSSFSFQGERGELLKRMIASMNLKEDEFFVSYLVKCKPIEENDFTCMMENCFNHVMNEIQMLKPKIIFSLGAKSTHRVLDSNERLSQIQGKFFIKKYLDKKGEEFQVKVMPLFHPDFLLINPRMKKITWENILVALNDIGIKDSP